jgi:glutathione S-transferase
MATVANNPLKLMGAPGSPYTRKMLALLRYRRIPYAVEWGTHRKAEPGRPEPKVKLVPVFYFPKADGEVEAVVDSTPIIRRLEGAYEVRSALPADPVLAFLNYLLEDYADEWLTKAMFHYRWRYKADIEHAGPLLIFWQGVTLNDTEAGPAAKAIAQRQIDRLYVVGSNDITADTIEESYKRFLTILDKLVQRRGYILGARPASADFGVFGQLTQLALEDPTPAAETSRRSLRVRAWVERMEDLSGCEPGPDDWFDRAQASEALRPLLEEVGRVYAPFLLQNARAAQAGEESWEGEIDGRPWRQPTFPYQARCLMWIREAFAALSAPDQAAARALIKGTGVEALLPSA